MELNGTDRSRSWFNGVGMQYDMGMLSNYDYRYFKQGNEENTAYYTVSRTKSREVSFFGTATYSYQGKYTINGTMRYEGSNKLGRSRSARCYLHGTFRGHGICMKKVFLNHYAHLSLTLH